MDFLNSLVSVFLVWALVTALFSANKARKRKLLLPPGPFPYPIVGNLFKLGDKPHKSLTDLAKTCGPIMSLRLGQVTTIVISSPTLAKEVMQTNDFSFSYRATPDSIRAQNHHLHSMVWLHPFNKWRSLRKISNSHIFANQRLDANQHLRQSKVEDLLLFVKECCGDGKPVNIGLAAFVTSLNLISNTVFSVDLVNPSYNSAQEFKELVWNIMVEAGKPNLADYFPVLRSIDPQGIRRRMSAHFAKMFEIFDHFIKQRMQSTEVADNDVLDVLLRIIHENKEINKEMMMHLFVPLAAFIDAAEKQSFPHCR
ncbi:Cytochrome P450 [Dillenia turbinata]|uniref:Cytochrome P450 n=1 Tax=Dillenia turbinata TaxID=194707 RepID=A0AAN8ZCA8_9MAGN